MNTVNQLLLFLDGFLGSSLWFPFVLLGVGIFFTFYLKFPQIRYFNHAWKLLTGKYDKKDAKGDTTHFQALTTALSGTVGTGNIGGVALAISIGGPAALFWMWMTAFFGMTTKFVEVTLSHKYREQTIDGTMAGGPMYYMDKRLNMKWLAILFAIATVICSFGTGNMPQINNIAQAMEASFDIKPWITGASLSILLALVILGGIKRIAAITSRVVPFMAAIYIIGALNVIFFNIENVLPSFLSIFTHAFTGTAASGGFLGAAFAYAFTKGVGRGLYSNEAGQGSAPIAHASAKTDNPTSEGVVSIVEPFIDTLIICTLTGLVILSSGVWTQKYESRFELSNMVALAVTVDETKPADQKQLFNLVNNEAHQLPLLSNRVTVKYGLITDKDFSLIHARSVAEDIVIKDVNDEPFTGQLTFDKGRLVTKDVTVFGKSLVHSAKLTAIAFQQGFLGNTGQYIVTLGLLLFAFSTTIAWSYYGDRAMTYLFGVRSIMPYRIVFIGAFFAASIADTTLIWNLANVAIVIMTLPNLLGIFMLRREMKQTSEEYWQAIKKQKS